MKPSRMFRAIVTAEIIVTVEPDREVEIHNDMLVLDTDDGQAGRVDFGALVNEAVMEHDAGPDLWTTPGQVYVGPIIELIGGGTS